MDTELLACLVNKRATVTVVRAQESDEWGVMRRVFRVTGEPLDGGRLYRADLPECGCGEPASCANRKRRWMRYSNAHDEDARTFAAAVLRTYGTRKRRL